jgi:hypothetical protein
VSLPPAASGWYSVLPSGAEQAASHPSSADETRTARDRSRRARNARALQPEVDSVTRHELYVLIATSSKARSL